MKKILYLLIAGVLFMGCEDFLDSDPLTQKTSANFPQNRADAEQLMAGIYTVMSSLQHRADESPLFIWEIASDDKLGGGGLNDVKAQAYETFQFSDNEMTIWPWQTLYQGVHRANFALEVIDNIPDEEVSPALKNQFKGEAKFLRAWYYWQLNTIFNEVPLKLTSDPINLPASSADDIYGQIASDLKAAIELMPNVPYTSTQQGRVTKWAAQGLMARCFLFYTGFYGRESIALPEGGSVTKANVIAWLEDLTVNSGHRLVDDFHELWPYTNSLTIGDYDYIQEYMEENDVELRYAADNGARNPEAIFVQQFNNFAAWDIDRGYSNTYQLFFALRGLQNVARTFPFAGGWGQGNSVPESLVNEWLEDEPNDPRLWASVIDIEAELMQRYVEAENGNYIKDEDGNFVRVADDKGDYDYAGYQRGQWDFVMESNYWGKKIHGVAVRTEQGQYYNTYSHLMYGTQNNQQLGHTDDLMFIRYADVLLMLSELKEDASYMNEVRARAGLVPVGWSLENLQKERRYELAFEGLRWNDMRRWGAEYTTEHLEIQEGVAILDFGEWTTHTALHPAGYTARYNATQGFFPIPFSQIRLSEGQLEQNAGYTEGGEGLYQGY